MTIRKKTAKQPVVIDVTEPEVPGSEGNPVMAGQDKSFVDNVRSGSKPALDGHVGKEALRIPLLAQKSIDERRVVTLKDLPA